LSNDKPTNSEEIIENLKGRIEQTEAQIEQNEQTLQSAQGEQIGAIQAKIDRQREAIQTAQQKIQDELNDL
jgi:type II secretory pathway component PulC